MSKNSFAIFVGLIPRELITISSFPEDNFAIAETKEAKIDMGNILKTTIGTLYKNSVINSLKSSLINDVSDAIPSSMTTALMTNSVKNIGENDCQRVFKRYLLIIIF
jgi:hypothetical protein